MFDKLREKWRKNKDLKRRKNALFDAVSSGYPADVTAATSAITLDELSDEDKSKVMRSTIDRQDMTVFKDVMEFLKNPNTVISYVVDYGRTSTRYTYSPLEYALKKARTHDISLALASNDLTRVNDSLLSAARNGGMTDVAAVLAKRIAGLRREEAVQLDKQAGVITEAPAQPAPAVVDDKPKITENWAVMSPTSVARVTGSEAIGRKLTEIFNFESRERVLITENLKTGVESIGVAESFDKLHPETVKKAEEALRKLLGESSVKPFNL